MVRLIDKQCGKCGYDLTGLEPVGRCPECGQEYDVPARKGIYDTASHQRHLEWVLRRIRTILLASVLACILICGGIFAILNKPKVLVFAALFALIFGLSTAVSYLYERDEE
ncbi:MAG: hypothetical protein WD042_08525 [Phycisphaeraceae bacterium]